MGRIMDDLGMITVKEAAMVCFNNEVTPGYIDAEIGRTISGWRIGRTAYTTIEEAEKLKIKPKRIRPLDGPGLYVVGYKSFVKIGISNNVRARIGGLQTSTPFKLVTYAVLEGGRHEEASLHRRFKPYRLSGEWFRKAGKLAAWVERGCV